MTNRNQNGSDSVGTSLEHYGIKGMRWGFRRTKAQLAKSRGEKNVKDPDSSDAKVAKNLGSRVKANKGDLSSLSNQELKTLTERMNLEKNYSTLKNAPKPKGEGRKFVEGIMRDLARETVKNAIKSTASGLAAAASGKKVEEVLKTNKK